MKGRRVVVTGVGAISAAGIGAAALMDAVCGPASFTRRITAFDPSGFPCQVGGEISGFSARDFVPKSYRKAVKVMARDIELAVAAADLALRDAGLVTRGIDESGVNVDGSRFACNIGAGQLCADLEELGLAVNSSLGADGRFDLNKWGREGMQDLTPLWLLKYLPNMLSCHVTIIHDLRGPSNTITCGEAAGILSVCEAADQIARGDADLALAGGAEAKINLMGLLRQGKLGRLATCFNDRPAEACRPFDADHAGSVLGEGAALLVLEERDRAVARRARVYGEVAGGSGAADPSALSAGTRHCGDVGLAARKALDQAGVSPRQLDLIVAHGTGVADEDLAEAAALTALLDGADAPVVSIMGAVGNCHAGAGALALAAAALSLVRQTAPACVNFTSPAEGCQKLNVPRQARPREIRHVLVQSFSHLGQSAAMVLKRYEASA
jgi:3-oxoacyl-[acyl-carrier-protein] synthase II